MKILQVKVGASRTYSCPGQPFPANEKPSVEFTADVAEGENPITVARQLRDMAEEFVERHKIRRLGFWMSMMSKRGMIRAQKKVISEADQASHDSQL